MSDPDPGIPDRKNPGDFDSNQSSYSGNLEDILRGKTLQVYTFMLKKSASVGIREIQRELNFSSPSVANYHVEKLITLSLVNKDRYGKYYVTQKVQVGVLQAFINLGGITVPRILFFAVFFTTLLASYIVVNVNNLNVHAIGFAASGAVAFWFETLRIWKIKH